MAESHSPRAVCFPPLFFLSFAGVKVTKNQKSEMGFSDSVQRRVKNTALQALSVTSNQAFWNSCFILFGF